MNKISALLLVLGISLISACASNEVADDATADAAMEAESAKAEMAEQKATAESDAQAEAADAKADMAESKAEAEDKVEEVRQEAEDTASAGDASDDSGNLVSTCTNGDQTRIISVIYDSDDTDTVCEVTYEKSTGVQTLWSANNERDYCKERAAEFVQKQEGWGWTCSNLE